MKNSLGKSDNNTVIIRCSETYKDDELSFAASVRGIFFVCLLLKETTLEYKNDSCMRN